MAHQCETCGSWCTCDGDDMVSTDRPVACRCEMEHEADEADEADRDRWEYENHILAMRRGGCDD